MYYHESDKKRVFSLVVYKQLFYLFNVLGMYGEDTPFTIIIWVKCLSLWLWIIIQIYIWGIIHRFDPKLKAKVSKFVKLCEDIDFNDDYLNFRNFVNYVFLTYRVV